MRIMIIRFSSRAIDIGLDNFRPTRAEGRQYTRNSYGHSVGTPDKSSHIFKTLD